MKVTMIGASGFVGTMTSSTFTRGTSEIRVPKYRFATESFFR